MMNLIWLGLGILTIVAAALLAQLAKRYRLNWIAWGGLGLGVGLILFCVAWSVASILEGVPRAASMGVVFFAFPGIVLITLTMKYVDAKLGKITAPAGALAAAAAMAAKTKEDSWPNFEMPHVDLPNIPIPVAEKLSKINSVINKSLRYVAWATLIAAFIFGLARSEKDYETMVKKEFPYEKLTKVNDDPVVFEEGEKKGATGNYIVIAKGQGYGGPFVLGVRIKEDAKIHEVIPLDHKETPGFVVKIEDANYRDQYEGKHVADDFIVDVDIDSVSGATITTMAATEAVRQAAHIAATQHFKLEPKWKSRPWNFGLDELLVLALFVLAFIPAVYAKKPWSYIYMGATVIIIGFYLNASISIASFGGLLMGFIPTVKGHIIWWILVVGTFLAVIIKGKNVWCFRICPFYGIQYLLGKIGGGKLKPSKAILKRIKFVTNFLLWLSLMIIFLSANPALGAFEPFAMMFSLTGVGIQWFILPLALIGSFFMSAFWCRFFCPCGHFITQLNQLRKKVLPMYERYQVREKVLAFIKRRRYSVK
jgi:Na+-translocating ferredoxin:NAD+ oxidoreductase RnfG subunit